MRWLLVLLCACSSTTSGRVEVATENGIVVIRDSQHVIEAPLPSTKGMTFRSLEWPELELPGRVVVGDEKDGCVIAVWITRLADKRPENIQRWFDDKVDMLRRKATILANHGMLVAGDHPGRQTDFKVTARGHESYARLFGIDVPEHDVDMLVLTIVATPQPTAEQLVWLDSVATDLRAIHIAPK